MTRIKHTVCSTALAAGCCVFAPTAVFAQNAPAIDALAAPPTETPAVTPVAATPMAPPEIVPPAREPVPSPQTPATDPDGDLALTNSLLAGFHNDLFFLSNRSGSFWIAPAGRLQIDAIAFTGGVTDDYTTGSAMTYHRGDVKDTFLMRRARLEMTGGFLRRFTWWIGADFAVSSAPIGTDLFINAEILPVLNLQIGQFDAPFTMENRTSDKYLDFMERSLAVRSLGIPSNKDFGAMLWGEAPNRFVYYSLGVFNGDGQNRANVDNNFDFMGRIFLHPFITLGGPLANLQIGGSFRYGTRGTSTNYAYNTMSTPGGYTFFNTALASGTSPVNLVPDGAQLDAAGELELPINRFDLRGEFVYVHNDTREMGATLSGTNPIRIGDLTGYGFYAQVGYWIYGDVGVNGRPGYENPAALHLHTPDPARPPQGLEILARFEDLNFTYSGGSRGAGGLPAQAYDGTYNVLGIDVGANYWATKHVRFSMDYMEYLFPSQPASTGAPGANDNRAHGPHGGAGAFGEAMACVAIAF